MLNRYKALAFGSVTLASAAVALPAFAACGAYVNGRPMTLQECGIGIQVYGGVQPGSYTVDGFGNWYHHQTGQRGNTLRDSQMQRRSTRGTNRSIFGQGRGAVIGGQHRSIFAEDWSR